MEPPITDIYRAVLENPSEDRRRLLVEVFLRDIDASLHALSRLIGGERTPDTIVAMTAVEDLIAALTLVSSTGKGKLRAILPREPVPGWGPLNTLANELAARGYLDVYRACLRPTGRFHAKRIVRELARIAKGLSVKNVDVTDATPPAIAGLYAGGVRGFLVLVYIGYIATYQYFTPTA